VAGAQRNPLPALRRPCVGAGTCQQGCNEGAKATTDQTHWPIAIEHGATLITGARVRRIVTESGLATGAEWIDEDGQVHFQAADVVVLAANSIGTARILLNSASPDWPDGLANSSGLVGRRLMMHPFASVTGLFDEGVESPPTAARHAEQCVESPKMFYDGFEGGDCRCFIGQVGGCPAMV